MIAVPVLTAFSQFIAYPSPSSSIPLEPTPATDQLASIARAQAVLDRGPSQVVGMGDREPGVGRREVRNVALDRGVGHQVAVVLEDCPLSLREVVEVGAHLRDVALHELLVVAVLCLVGITAAAYPPVGAS